MIFRVESKNIKMYLMFAFQSYLLLSALLEWDLMISIIIKSNCCCHPSNNIHGPCIAKLIHFYSFAHIFNNVTKQQIRHLIVIHHKHNIICDKHHDIK